MHTTHRDDMGKKRFSAELREWRGTRTQTTAAKVLRVNIHTFRNWEQEKAPPSHPEMVRYVMQMNPDLS